LRAFLDAILSFINTTSLTDVEFATIESTSQTYTEAVYLELLAVLDSRETVSTTRDRLRYYFLARGVSVGESSVASSNIFVGDEL